MITSQSLQKHTMVKTSYLNSVLSVLSLYQQSTKTALKCGYSSLRTNWSSLVAESGIRVKKSGISLEKTRRCVHALHEVSFQLTCALRLFVNPLEL